MEMVLKYYILKKKINFETLEGYGGVIYNKQHFKSDFMEKMVTYEKYILMNDDLIISSYLKSNSIEIKHVNVHKYKFLLQRIH